MSKSISNIILNNSKRSLKSIEKDIVKNYKIALDNIKLQLLKLEEKSALTQNEALKYGRLQSLQDSINGNLKDIAGENYKTIEYSRKKNFIESYNKTLEGFGFAKVNADFVNSSLANPLWNANFKNDLADVTKKASRKISNEISQGIIKGDSLANISKKIKGLINNDAKKAITIARTETLRAMSEGQLAATDKLEERGFKIKKIWLYSYHIKGSRPEHEAMDGKEADEDGLFRYIEQSTGQEIAMPAPRMSMIASADINCRCSYYTEIIE